MAVPIETPLLIGVDGGATEVKAHAVDEVEGGLEPGAQRAAFRYATVAGFVPKPMREQLEQRERGSIELAAYEREQSERWIDACAHAVESVAAGAGRAGILVGMCMPGLKTRDGRGIDAMRNGPRAPELLDRLEARLAHDGLALAAPIARLVSDGDACGHGEDAAPTGGFRGVASAYYIGGGTGLAECFKIDGRITGLDDLAGRVEKGWAMTSSLGASFEDHISLRGINARYRELGGDKDSKPEEAWQRDETAAVHAWMECVVMMEELCESRRAALERAGLPELERLVVGQRLGSMLAMESMKTLRVFAECSMTVPVRISTLREAPAIGAARLALETWRESGRARAGGTANAG